MDALMTREEWFATWAPDDSLWARWVRPVLFAQFDPAALEAWPAATPSQAPALSAGEGSTAVVLELPGPQAVGYGMRLAHAGYRPVPLFNGSDGPAPLIEVRPIAQALLVETPVLAGLALPPQAPPAFLLDSRRMQGVPHAHVYDNRWVMLPQDFPSATMLRSHGIERVVLVQEGARAPAADLAHVLRRWQEGGVALRLLDIARGGEAVELEVKKPAWYRSLWWGIVALAGLRRSNVGGFGGMVPEQTSGGGFA